MTTATLTAPARKTIRERIAEQKGFATWEAYQVAVRAEHEQWIAELAAKEAAAAAARRAARRVVTEHAFWLCALTPRYAYTITDAEMASTLDLVARGERSAELLTEGTFYRRAADGRVTRTRP
jgi:hypothetical protein